MRRLLNWLCHSAGCCQGQDYLLPQTPGSCCKDNLQSKNFSVCGKGSWMHLNPVVNTKCTTWFFFSEGLCLDKSSVVKGMWVLTTEQLIGSECFLIVSNLVVIWANKANCLILWAWENHLGGANCMLCFSLKMSFFAVLMLEARFLSADSNYLCCWMAVLFAESNNSYQGTFDSPRRLFQFSLTF